MENEKPGRKQEKIYADEETEEDVYIVVADRQKDIQTPVQYN